MIRQIHDPVEKMAIARRILEALPEWFGIPESREQYIADSALQIMLADIENDAPRGFMCLKQTGDATVELAVMGVLKEHHRSGIGRRLFNVAKAIVHEQGYSFMQVKTVKMGMYEEYDRTNLFYQSIGFREFEVFPELWDEANPCQIYIMYIGK